MDTLSNLTSGVGLWGRISAAALAQMGLSLFQILILIAVFAAVVALIRLAFSRVKSLAGATLWLRTKRALQEKENVARVDETKRVDVRRESGSVRRFTRPAVKAA